MSEETKHNGLDCWCEQCHAGYELMASARMFLCPDCGNKRCPRATSHQNACTGSNEPGQEGSSYFFAEAGIQQGPVDIVDESRLTAGGLMMAGILAEIQKGQAAVTTTSSLNTPEPAPVGNDSRPIWDLVIEDMRERDRGGREKYGVPLQAGNGRKPLVDAYQEKLDECVYIRQEIEERAKLDAELAKAKIDQSCLQNLLATIHGDGGHRAAEFGVVTATSEAMGKWLALSAKAETLDALSKAQA